MGNSKKRACTFKRYMTQDQAYAGARRLWKEEHFVTTYKCSYCAGWHHAKHKRRHLESLFQQIEAQLHLSK
jgi:hypothetical protein